jgi:hypothetical protein
MPRSSAILAGVALLTLAATSPLIDPTPDGCDAYLQYDGTVCISTRRAMSPSALLILGESARKSVRSIDAWRKHDARLIEAEIPTNIRLPGPNGKVMRKADLVRDIRRRMAVTRVIDSITVAIRVDTLTTDSAIVRSRQFFSRMVAMPDSTQRRRFSSVTHREIWVLRAGRWGMRNFTEENQVASWVDETPK